MRNSAPHKPYPASAVSPRISVVSDIALPAVAAEELAAVFAPELATAAPVPVPATAAPVIYTEGLTACSADYTPSAEVSSAETESPASLHIWLHIL